MNAIKTVMITFVLFVMSFGLVTASELATKDEVVQKCIEVGKIISTKGVDEAIRQVNDTSGSFVWKDTYVYLMDLEATILAHGPQPKFIGKNLMGLKDPITKKPWYPALYKKIKVIADKIAVIKILVFGYFIFVCWLFYEKKSRRFLGFFY